MTQDPGLPTGVLLANLGSPEAPETGPVRRYLREFLSDPKVVDLNPLFWRPLLNLVILPLRAPKSAAAYRTVWMEEGSPLIVHSARQRELLERELGVGWKVALGMRYGKPSLDAALDELARAGCRRVVLLPLFPQWSETTNGTLEEAVRRALARRGDPPQLAIVGGYPDDPGYVEALAETVRAAREAGPASHTVFSFHGLPVRYVEAGDPYQDHCERTAAALAGALGLGEGEWTLAYQSRFGREPWLEPNAAELVPALAERHPRVLILCPGFPADCLETLEEIGDRLRADFRAAGGEELRVVPCLNETPRWIAALAELARQVARNGAGGAVGPGSDPSRRDP